VTACTGAVCAVMRERGPRCGVDVEVETLRRLEELALVRRVAGAGGAADSTVVQSPILSSPDAERMRFDDP